MKYRSGDWYVFCDICGQRCYASETGKLSAYTGRGGLIVCENDKDEVDFGLVPFTIPAEQNVPFTRINHTNTDNGTAVEDIETSSEIGV